MPLPPAERRRRRAIGKTALDVNKLPRKRCSNCPGFFRLTRKNKRFCSPQCKQEFHDNGGTAFGPLKDRLEKYVLKRLTQMHGELQAQLSALLDRVEQIERDVATNTGKL